MSRIVITVDNKTLMDADPGTWTYTPPDLDALKLQTGTPQPWMQSIMFALAEVATKAFAGQPQQDTTITVTTRDGGWTLDCDG